MDEGNTKTVDPKVPRKWKSWNVEYMGPGKQNNY